jgi:hypothetical protein
MAPFHGQSRGFALAQVVTIPLTRIISGSRL